MPAPGSLTRAEYATGLLVRSVKVNGYYLLLDNCTLNQNQEIETTEKYLQGGPGQSVSIIDAKKISGQISCTLRINKNGDIENGVKELLKHAECPINALSIQTNHAFSHYNITADSHATDNNELITISTAVISSLSMSCSPDNEVKVTAEFEGMLDSRTVEDFILPDQLDILGRSISWGDCDISRSESSMRNSNSIDITVTNTLDTPVFLIPYFEDPDLSIRNDQIHHVGITATKWSGKTTELLRKGAETHTHIHGGWIEQDNISVKFGPVTATFITPLYKIAQLPLTPSVFTRTTEWVGLTRPAASLTPGGLFSFE
jgi:hypothetical protein